MSGYNFLSKLNPFAGYRQPNPLDPYAEMNASGEEDPFATMPMGTPPPQNPFNPSLPVEEPAISTPPKYMNSSLNQYKASLANQPMQEDYRPSKKRIFGGIALGGLAGMGANNPKLAFDMSRSIVRAPYENAMEEWKTTTSGFKDAASLEETQNKQGFDEWYKQEQIKSLSGYRTGTLDSRNRGLDIRDEYNDARLEIMRQAAQGLFKIEYNRTTGQAVKAMKDGTLVPVDPKVLRGLTFEQQEMLESMGALSIVDARGRNAESLAEINARHAKELADARNKNAIDVANIRSDGRPQTAADLKVQNQNRAGEFQRLHPEWADWVQQDESTQGFRIVPPSSMFNRPKPEDVVKATNAFNEYLRTGGDTAGPGAVPGDNSGSVTPGSGPTVNPPAGPRPRQGPRQNPGVRTAPKPGYVWMIAPDGKTRGQVKKEEVARLEGQGYKKE